MKPSSAVFKPSRAIVVKVGRFKNARPLNLSACALLIPFLFACSSATSWIKNAQMESYFRAFREVEERYPDAGAVVLLDEAVVEVFPGSEHGFSEYTRHTVIKILNERGHRYANVLIPYDDNSRVNDIRARTVFPDGRTVTLSKNEIFDTNLYPEFIFYSDDRTKRFTVPSVEDGCLIETEWRKTIDHFSFWTRWDFQQPDPVLISRYTARCPNDCEIKWKSYGIDLKPDIEALPRGMKADHTWKAENLSPVREEAAMPPGDGGAAYLMFSSAGAKAWKDIAAWHHEICKDRTDPDEAIRVKVAELTDGFPDPREKLKRLFEFVRDRVRYIAIEVGAGGYQPHDAPSVFKKRYGDCKDMTALIAAMAKAAGVAVRPVLISTWQNGEVDTSLVSQSQFNHAMAVAELPDGSAVWMDATEKTCAFGDLPWYDQDRLVFIVKGDSLGEFVRTPRSGGAAGTRLTRRWELAVDSTGCGLGSAAMTFHGIAAGEMRHQLRRLSEAEIRNWIGRQLSTRFPGVVCDSSRLENLRNPDKPLRLSAAFSSAQCLTRDGSAFSMRPADVARYDLNTVFPERERRYPVVLQYPTCVSDTVRIRHPAGWTFASGTVCDSASASFGKYQWRMSVPAAGEFLYARRLQISGTAVDTARYPGFRDFINRVAEGDKAAVVFQVNP